jgi:hypothetical protein
VSNRGPYSDRQLPATMAQPGRLEYERASRHAPPQQVGEEPD